MGAPITGPPPHGHRTTTRTHTGGDDDGGDGDEEDWESAAVGGLSGDGALCGGGFAGVFDFADALNFCCVLLLLLAPVDLVATGGIDVDGGGAAAAAATGRH